MIEFAGKIKQPLIFYGEGLAAVAQLCNDKSLELAVIPELKEDIRCIIQQLTRRPWE
jgi:hypothetical protein